MPVADAGLMRERVALLRQVPTVDAHNQPVEDWRTVAHVWAAIRPLTSRELLASRRDRCSTRSRSATAAS